MSQFKTVFYPKIHQRTDGRVEVVIFFQGKRMRLQSGRTFGVQLKPNSFPLDERLSQAKLLAAEIYSRLIAGYNPYDKARVSGIADLSDCKVIQKVIKQKKAQGISKHYFTQLQYSFRMLQKKMKGDEITPLAIERLLSD